MDDLFRGVFEYLRHRSMRAVARILEGHNYAAIASLVAGLTTLCVALILVRGLDILGIGALCTIAVIIAWSVLTSVRRILRDIRGRNTAPGP